VLALLPLLASAQMYRWTDEKGVVNYSNTPPPKGTPAVKVPEAGPTLPLYPSPPFDPVAAPRPSEREDALRDRVDALERELDSQRRDRVAAAEADADRRRRAKEECERQRRVDCDRPELIQDGPIVVVPRVRPRPNIQPTVPIPEKKPPPQSSGIERKDPTSGKFGAANKG